MQKDKMLCLIQDQHCREVRFEQKVSENSVMDNYIYFFSSLLLSLSYHLLSCNYLGFHSIPLYISFNKCVTIIQSPQCVLTSASSIQTKCLPFYFRLFAPFSGINCLIIFSYKKVSSLIPFTLFKSIFIFPLYTKLH